MVAHEPEDAAVVVPHARTSVAEARRLLRRAMTRECVVGQVRDDVLVVISELVSNAVKHARPLPTGGIRVSWAVSTCQIQVSVTDGGSPTAPTASAAAMSALGGRGLNIVRVLTRSWSVTCTPEGTTVCATVAR